MDHEQRLSFAVIIGSFRGRGEEELDQHYVSLSYLHEPKGGLLPAELEKDSGEESQDRTRNADAAKEGGGGIVEESLQGRSSEVAKRFSRWIREQRLAVLRGFGVDEGWEGGEGKERDALGTQGGLRKGGAGVGAAQGEVGRKELVKDKDEPNAASGSNEDSDASIDRDPKAEGLLDPLSEEQDEGARQAKRDDEDVGMASDGEKDPADAGSDEEEDEGGRSEGNYWFGGVGDGELVKVVREPRAPIFPPLPASDSEETVREVETRQSEGHGTIEAVRGQASFGVAEAGGEGETADELFAAPASPLPRPSLRAPRRAGPSVEYLAGQGNSTELTHTFHAFPPADTVTISCRGEPVDSMPNLQDDPNFTWEADGIG